MAQGENPRALNVPRCLKPSSNAFLVPSLADVSEMSHVPKLNIGSSFEEPDERVRLVVYAYASHSMVAVKERKRQEDKN